MEANLSLSAISDWQGISSVASGLPAAKGGTGLQRFLAAANQRSGRRLAGDDLERNQHQQRTQLAADQRNPPPLAGTGRVNYDAPLMKVPRDAKIMNGTELVANC